MLQRLRGKYNVGSNTGAFTAHKPYTLVILFYCTLAKGQCLNMAFTSTLRCLNSSPARRIYLVREIIAAEYQQQQNQYTRYDLLNIHE